MISLVPVRIASLTGHVVIVTPGGADVPEHLVEEAMRYGCAPEALVAQHRGLSAARPVPQEDMEIEVVSEGREQRLRQAIARIIERNNPNEFTLAGQPRVSTVRRELGEDVSFEEINDAMTIPAVVITAAAAAETPAAAD